MNYKGKKVFVGLSGGVDSSVSAARLVAQGASVTGVFIKGWYPSFVSCDWKTERRDAMRVAASLGIPFLTCDAEEEYKKNVIDYMISEYEAGRTPNPDIMCNKYVKFGAFFRFAMQHGADYIATGHYARAEDGTLLVSKDTEKDQTYFLWSVAREQLSRTLFPVGGFKKDYVRSLAKKYRLSTADKKDSQGLCFLGKIDMKDFLRHHLSVKKGDVCTEDGRVIGVHNGALLYTIGERHGISVTDPQYAGVPYYVIARDVEKNTLIVSSTPSAPEYKKVHGTLLHECVWSTPLVVGKTYMCRFRYRQKLFPCVYENEGRITFLEPHTEIPVGQSLVVYDGDVCCGGGIIESLL